MARTPHDLFRKPTAREAAMRQYASDFDRHADAAQTVLLPNDPRKPMSEATAATIARVAWLAEDSKAPSPNPPWCICPTCQAYLFAVRWERQFGGMS